MRKISTRTNVSAPSLVEVRRALRDERDRLSDETAVDMLIGAEFGQRVAPPAYLVNWVLCWFLTRPADQREQITREGRKIFDVHLASDRPIGFGSPRIESDDVRKRHENERAEAEAKRKRRKAEG